MRRRFLGNHLALALIAATAACTTPQHSNALIFGTNTSFGLNVGQNATGTPSIQVGYNRQEAVFMPLVANARYDANGVPTPCDVYPGRNYQPTGAAVVNGQSVPQVPPCFLVGQNGGSLDSYSVLASFGAQFSANGTTPSASGGLAQFFATGIAAQLLAIRGGPALVATGQAAATVGGADTSAEIAALYHSPEVLRRTPEIIGENAVARNNAVTYLNSLDDTQFGTRFPAFAERLGMGRDYCKDMTKAVCMQRLTDRNVLTDQDKSTIDAAVLAARNVGG